MDYKCAHALENINTLPPIRFNKRAISSNKTIIKSKAAISLPFILYCKTIDALCFLSSVVLFEDIANKSLSEIYNLV